MPVSDSGGQSNDRPQRLYLRLLGSPALSGEGELAGAGLGPGKSLAMLAYLAVRGRVRRDELINLLWGDIPEDKARNAFRQSLHRLRGVLGDEILPQHRDQVGIEPANGLQVDRDLFIGACESGRWEEAVEVYAGEFLEGFEAEEPAFDRWADAERVRLRARFQEALRAAGEASVADGRVSDALEYARRLSATAPYDEAPALFEANTLVAAGRQAQAISAIQQFGARLRDDLDLPLPDAARTLLERLEKRALRQSPTSAAAADRGKLPPFVGRDGELARMLSLASALRSERGATLLLEGAAGMGKSRLLDEFAERVRSLGGVTVLRGREAGLGSVVPYAGIAEALRPIVHAPGVAGASRHLLAEAARLLPELRDAFDLPDAAPIEDETGRLRFFEGVAALVDAAAYERPACILIDDAQLASSSTLDLLLYLSRRLHQSPVLIVVACRSDRAAVHGIDRLRELVASDSDDVLLALPPLSAEESEALARDLTRGSPRVAASDISRIARVSGGRPYAVVDLARRMLLGESPSESLTTLRDVLWARFQVASPSKRRVFFAASLFERAASLHLLAAAAHLPELTVLEAVDSLIGDGLLRATDAGYVVAHDSTASFLVDTSGIAGRSLLAAWAADALAAEPDRTDAELAALYALAGRGADAFVHARAGAFAAAAVGATTEVSQLLGTALTFAPDDQARAEIESLLTAFGRTRLALPAPGTAPFEEEVAEEAEEEVPPPAAAPPREPTPGEPVAATPPRRARWEVGTIRQWTVSIAVSLIVVIAGLAARRAIENRRVRAGIADTLFVEERDARGRTALRVEAQPATSPDQEPVPAAGSSLAPAWTDTLRPPFSTPLVSPDGRRVALRRASPRGDEVYVISADRRDTIPLVTGGGDNAALGWAPDGLALLVSRTRTISGEAFQAGLFAYAIGSGAPPVTLDTNPSHTVTEASWSPTGTSVAWVARVGTSRQREIFVSRADGSGARNLSANPGEDYGISWSPDASLLAFASTRSGGSRLYVYDFDNARLWTASDRAGESHPIFSPDGRSLAFESTRDGDLAVYLRPALGGTPRRITPRGRQFSLVAWRGAPPSFVDRLRIIGPSFVGLGDSLALSVLSVGPDGRSIPAVTTEWSLVDHGVLDLTARDSGATHVIGRTLGEARVAVQIPGWRADTIAIAVTSPSAVDIQDRFDTPALDARWLPLGVPSAAPGRTSNGSPALFPNGDLEWESGVLLRHSIELRPGLNLRVKIVAPAAGQANSASLTIGFVPAAPAAALDRVAPRLSPIVGAQWDGSSGTLAYTVGAERQVDAAAPSGAGVHELGIAVSATREIVFTVDGAQRWRSSLRYVGEAEGAPVQLWIGGRATAHSVAVSDFRLELPPRAAR